MGGSYGHEWYGGTEEGMGILETHSIVAVHTPTALVPTLSLRYSSTLQTFPSTLIGVAIFLGTLTCGGSELMA